MVTAKRLKNKPTHLGDFLDPAHEVMPGFEMDAMFNKLNEAFEPDKGLTNMEIEQRILARNMMRHFIPFTFPEYKIDQFHVSVCDDIDRVVHLNHERPITHLMLNAPPQHGKSEIVSTRLPAYWLAHNPDLPVALVSYAQDLANRNSRNARSVFESDQYRQLFSKLGILKDYENWRVRDWHLSGHKGYAFAAGVGGPITGRGFGCAIIDDPIENWAAAQSETIRDSVYEWWKGTLKTRLWPGYRVIFMMTRWHEDDLQARILEQEGRRDYCTSCNYYFADEYLPEKCPECGGVRGRWTVRSYAALAETQEERDEIARNANLREGKADILGREPREPLAPALNFDRDFLEQQAIDVGPLVWGAEYQQHPSPPKGDMFKIGQIPPPEEGYPIEDFGGELIEDRPVHVRNAVRFWDLAASEKKMGTDPDFTSGTLLGQDKSKFTWVLHQTSLQAEPDQVLQMIKDTAALDGRAVKIFVEQEGGASGKSLIKTLQRELSGYILEGIPSTGSKQTRAYLFSAQVNAGNVRLVKAAWNKMWLARHRVFPHGKHDDEVDSTSGAFNEVTGGQRWSSPKFRALGH
jgi:predicted phage terminase large subunit-like protein